MMELGGETEEGRLHRCCFYTILIFPPQMLTQSRHPANITLKE